MASTGIHALELIFLLLLVFVAALAALAKRFNTPYPIFLVIGGLILSFFPRAPRVELNPDIFFLVILPPLLFSSAFLTSWRDFRYNLVSIFMLAFGLVGFTVVGVALASRWILPGFDWRMGLVLGAVVSTTDAIAATAVAKRLGLPKRITDILEGESLANDATGLLALEFAVAILISGHTPTISEGVGRLLYLVFGSVVVGLVVGRAIYFVETKIVDPSIEITLSLIAPYIAYLAAEGAHASGVFSTVACGLYLGHKSSLYFSIGARLKSGAVWDTLTFILNGFVFILIGLQLPYILANIPAMNMGRLFELGLLFSAVVVLLRLLWVFPGSWLGNIIRRRLLHQPEPRPNPRAVFLVGWTGMRGVLALAAAIALPRYLENGSPFPQRDTMIFLTFSVIFVTLVLHGLTLPPLIRKLGLAGAEGKDPEELKARRAITEAALTYLEDIRDLDPPECAPVYNELIQAQRRRLHWHDEPSADAGDRRHDYELFRDLTLKVQYVQRAALLNLRNQNEINDEVMRKLEREIDMVELRYSPTEEL
jgi:monovalent cation/hydrogen antiporter